MKTPTALLGRNYFVTLGIAPPFPGRHGRVAGRDELLLGDAVTLQASQLM